jgi:hypothetical protein
MDPFIFNYSVLSALMCRTDGSHYGDQGLLQKVQCCQLAEITAA